MKRRKIFVDRKLASQNYLLDDYLSSGSSKFSSRPDYYSQRLNSQEISIP
jgi:hypothetical protein